MTPAFNRRISLIGKNGFNFGYLPLLQVFAKFARTRVIKSVSKPKPFC